MSSNTEFDYSELYAEYIPNGKAVLEYHSGYFRGYIRRWLATANRQAPVLDVGCGWGFFLEAFKKEGFTNCLGIDISAGQVASCTTLGNPAKHEPDTLAFLERHPNTFEVIVMIDVVEHLPLTEQIRYFRALHTALRPGGVLLMRMPNADSPIAMRMRYIDVTHVTSFTGNSISFLLHQGGFQHVEIADELPYINHPGRLWPWRKTTWEYLGYRLLTKFFKLWRRLELTAYCGHELGFTTPIAPNLVAVTRKNPARKDAP